MTAPVFTVAQTGHSGSAYTSAVLYACGIACGHEQWWTLPDGEQVDQLDGDSSWLATSAPGWGDYRGAVFHQVRHPLPCIGSIANYYRNAPDDDPYLWRRLVSVVGPAIDDLRPIRDGAVRLAAITWLTMNRQAAERASLSWRVEAFDVPHVMAVAAACGLPLPDLAAARTAVRAVPRDLNAHGRIGLTWRDLAAECPARVVDEVRVAAHCYGYLGVV